MFSFLIIILVKNHNLFLVLDNQTVKSLSIWSINWISSIYSCEHVEYSNADFYSTTVSMLTILQHQFSLFSQAHWLFSNASLFSCAQFSWLNFFWFKFSHSFSVIFLFDWSHSHVWDFDQIYYHKQLFCFVSCSFWKVSHLSLFFHCVLSSCLRFQSSSLLWVVIQSHAAFLRKIFCLHLQFQKCKIS